MGIEHAGVCHDCKEWIDCHKCYAAADLVHVAQTGEFSWAENDGRKPEFRPAFSYWGENLGYWGARLVWFILGHASHRVEVLRDCDDRYFEILPVDGEGEYKEVQPHTDADFERYPKRFK